DRVNGSGVTEATVVVEGTDQIVVSIPGGTNTDVEKLGAAAVLNFRGLVAPATFVTCRATPTPSPSSSSSAPSNSSSAPSSAPSSSSASTHGLHARRLLAPSGSSSAKPSTSASKAPSKSASSSPSTPAPSSSSAPPV